MNASGIGDRNFSPVSQKLCQGFFKIVEEEDVEFIRLQFTDIFGTLKNVAITSSQLEKALNNKCMFDGSSIEGFAHILFSFSALHLLIYVNTCS